MAIDSRVLKKGLQDWYGSDFDSLKEDIETLESMSEEDINFLIGDLEELTDLHSGLNNGDVEDEDDENMDIENVMLEAIDCIARGFGISFNTVEYLWDNVDTLKTSMPELEFVPNEMEFRKNLLEKHIAKRIIYYEDGKHEEKVWKASKFNESSDLRNNIFTGPLRNWKKKGIIKAKFLVK
jgi:hypothetical protein